MLKHRQISNTILDEINTGKLAQGERLPGEQDLAIKFEVSYMTMRQAITNLVADGVVLRIKGKGTFVVDQKRDRPSKKQTVGFLFPGELQRMDPYYFPDVLSGFNDVVEKHGSHVNLIAYDSQGSFPRLESVASIACLLFEQPSLGVIESLRDSGIPVVAVNRYRGRRTIPSVWIDDAEGIGYAVDYLVSMGHERINFVPGPAENLDAADRLRGFRSAVKKHGLRYSAEVGSGFTEASGYRAFQTILSNSNRPTAVVCASDITAWEP